MNDCFDVEVEESLSVLAGRISSFDNALGKNGSLIRVHTERAVFMIIYITCNLL